MQALDHASITVRDLARALPFGRDAGAPGLRPGYHPAYYAAFLEDPEGNRIEAVSHRGES